MNNFRFIKKERPQDAYVSILRRGLFLSRVSRAPARFRSGECLPGKWSFPPISPPSHLKPEHEDEVGPPSFYQW